MRCLRNRTFIPLALVVLTAFGVFCAGCCEREAENSAVKSVRVLLTNEAGSLPCTSNQTTVCVNAKKPNWNALDTELQKLFARVSANNKVEVCYRDISRIPLVVEGNSKIDHNMFKAVSLYSLKAGFYNITWKATGTSGEKDFMEVQIPVDEEYPLRQCDTIGPPIPCSPDSGVIGYGLHQHKDSNWMLDCHQLPKGELDDIARLELEVAGRNGKKVLLSIGSDLPLETGEYIEWYYKLLPYLKVVNNLSIDRVPLDFLTADMRNWLFNSYSAVEIDVYLFSNPIGKQTIPRASSSNNDKPVKLEAYLEEHIRERAKYLAVFSSLGKQYVISILNIYPQGGMVWGELDKALSKMADMGFSEVNIMRQDNGKLFKTLNLVARGDCEEEEINYEENEIPYSLFLTNTVVKLEAHYYMVRPGMSKAERARQNIDGEYSSFEQMIAKMKGLSQKIGHIDLTVSADCKIERLYELTDKLTDNFSELDAEGYFFDLY